jgi:hypothetical protein
MGERGHTPTFDKENDYDIVLHEYINKKGGV